MEVIGVERYIDNIAYKRYVAGTMDYAIHFAGLLRPHLQALRKKRGLTQAQLGAMLGVGQVRIAEIESGPGAVSVEQLIRVLSALDTTLVVRDALPETKGREPEKAPAASKELGKKAASTGHKDVPVPGELRKRPLGGGPVLVSRKDARTVTRRDIAKLRSENPDASVTPTSGRNALIRPKKGSW